MAPKRSVVPTDSRAVSIVVPLTVFGTIPATALRGLPHSGSVEDVLSALISREVERGMRVYETHGKRRVK